MADPKNSRGYRNRNPGNIDFQPANRWQGQTGKEEGGRFATFDSHENGIRALAALLTTYQDRHGLRTIAGIVSRWAPGNENNTEAYISHVAALMQRGPRDVLDLHAYADLRPLVEAIITHELSGQPYAAAVLDEGLRRAGVVRPVETLTDAARTGTGRGAVAGVVGTGAVAVAVQAAPVLSALQGLDWRVGVAVIVVAGAAVLAFVLSRRAKSAA